MAPVNQTADLFAEFAVHVLHEAGKLLGALDPKEACQCVDTKTTLQQSTP
jgi:hypothetical protein